METVFPSPSHPPSGDPPLFLSHYTLFNVFTVNKWVHGRVDSTTCASPLR